MLSDFLKNNSKKSEPKSQSQKSAQRLMAVLNAIMLAITYIQELFLQAGKLIQNQKAGVFANLDLISM